MLLEVAAALDRLGVEYLLGGSLASSVLGEPRATIDIDLAIALREASIPDLVDALEPRFFVDPEAVRRAVATARASTCSTAEAMLKVDLFVLGDSELDREQLRRRVHVSVSPDTAQLVAVSSAEDLVLRKLARYRAGGGASDRQWRDVLGDLEVQRGRRDLAYLRHWSAALGVGDLRERALEDSGTGRERPRLVHRPHGLVRRQRRYKEAVRRKIGAYHRPTRLGSLRLRGATGAGVGAGEPRCARA